MKITVSTLLSAVLTIAVFTPFVASAQPVSQEQPHYSHSELKQMIRDAHTPQQYQALALYFRSQQQVYNSKADAAKAEWDRRKAATASPALKNPGNAESAHNLYDYYVAKANDMAALAASFEQRSQ
jgi:hypothetical protein